MIKTEERSPIDVARLEQEAREARIRKYLRADDEMKGKAYDGRLHRRLGGNMSPYKSKL